MSVDYDVFFRTTTIPIPECHFDDACFTGLIVNTASLPVGFKYYPRIPRSRDAQEYLNIVQKAIPIFPKLSVRDIQGGIYFHSEHSAEEINIICRLIRALDEGQDYVFTVRELYQQYKDASIALILAQIIKDTYNPANGWVKRKYPWVINPYSLGHDVFSPTRLTVRSHTELVNIGARLRECKPWRESKTYINNKYGSSTIQYMMCGETQGESLLDFVKRYRAPTTEGLTSRAVNTIVEAMREQYGNKENSCTVAA